MLPSRVGQARIFTCDWPSELFEESNLIQKRIEELALLLLDGIKRRPLATEACSGRKDRPILFIASCFGGIILMKVPFSQKSHTRHYLPCNAVRRHFVPDVAAWAEPGLKAWASIRGQKVSKMLESVKKPTVDVDELARSFTKLCQDGHLDQVMTFYEMGKTSLTRRIFSFLPISSKQVRLTKASRLPPSSYVLL